MNQPTVRGYNEPSQFAGKLLNPNQSSYISKQQHEEVHLLKNVITKLCEKLKDYQKEFKSNKPFLAKEQ